MYKIKDLFDHWVFDLDQSRMSLILNIHRIEPLINQTLGIVKTLSLTDRCGWVMEEVGNKKFHFQRLTKSVWDWLQWYSYTFRYWSIFITKLFSHSLPFPHISPGVSHLNNGFALADIWFLSILKDTKKFWLLQDWQGKKDLQMRPMQQDKEPGEQQPFRWTTDLKLKGVPGYRYFSSQWEVFLSLEVELSYDPSCLSVGQSVIIS